MGKYRRIHSQSHIIRYTDTHTHKHIRLCLVFGEKLWKRQLWCDGEGHAGLTFSSRWFTANSARRLHCWSSTGLTDTDGKRPLIRLVSGLTTNIQWTEHQLSLSYISFSITWGPQLRLSEPFHNPAEVQRWPGPFLLEPPLFGTTSLKRYSLSSHKSLLKTYFYECSFTGFFHLN